MAETLLILALILVFLAIVKRRLLLFAKKASGCKCASTAHAPGNENSKSIHAHSR